METIDIARPHFVLFHGNVKELIGCCRLTCLKSSKKGRGNSDYVFNIASDYLLFLFFFYDLKDFFDFE